MGSQPEGRLVYNRPGEIVIWINKRMQVNTNPDGSLYTPFRGPKSVDYKITIDRKTGAVTVPDGLPRNQGIIITVQAGDKPAAVTRVP